MFLKYLNPADQCFKTLPMSIAAGVLQPYITNPNV